jgi:tRNA pseudouridine55 synthase
MGRRRNNLRIVNGILLLDKPQGLTSNEALQVVKRLFKARKAGHTGSLDPLATGMLPLCFGQATKVSGFLLDANKRYTMSAKLGQTTTTADAEGEVVEEKEVPELEEASIESVLSEFTGEIDQIPPMYSALRHNGERLYKLARKGVEVERKSRKVIIYELKLRDFSRNMLDLEVKCSKGTYVRTLVEDIGAKLGCGAHVTALRRLEVGPYMDPGQMVTLDELEHRAEQGFASLDKALLPVESALLEWPDVRLSSDVAFYMRQGQAVVVPHAPTSGWVRLYENGEKFMGMGEIQDDGKVAPKRLFGS